MAPDEQGKPDGADEAADVRALLASPAWEERLAWAREQRAQALARKAAAPAGAGETGGAKTPWDRRLAEARDHREQAQGAGPLPGADLPAAGPLKNPVAAPLEDKADHLPPPLIPGVAEALPPAAVEKAGARWIWALLLAFGIAAGAGVILWTRMAPPPSGSPSPMMEGPTVDPVPGVPAAAPGDADTEPPLRDDRPPAAGAAAPP